jgi:hypothetical protein
MAKKIKRTQPMQPIEWDGVGVIRFRSNKIVKFLLDQNGRIDMNMLAAIDFPQEDREQFAQLIGYSVSGFGDLSYASKKTVEEADSKAAELYELTGGKDPGKRNGE